MSFFINKTKKCHQGSWRVFNLLSNILNMIFV